VKWLAIALLLTGILLTASKVPLDRKEAHRRADAVLYPLLIAAMNDYGLNHGDPNGPGHLDRMDAKDKERLKTLREAFYTWDEAIRQAGY